MKLSPGATQHEKNAHYRSVLKAYVDAVCRDDVDAVCALFAPDSIVEDPIGIPVREGAEAIRAFYAHVAERQVRLRILGPVTGSKGNAAAMPLRIEVLGAVLNCISVARFDGQGLISHYMAHWGPGDYDEASGDPSARQKA